MSAGREPLTPQICQRQGYKPIIISPLAQPPTLLCTTAADHRQVALAQEATMQELLERAFDAGKAPAHACSSGQRIPQCMAGVWHWPFVRRQTDDAPPSLCRPASLCAVVAMNQATDTDLFKVSRQPPNQLCVPKTLAIPTPPLLATAARLETGACQRPVVGFPKQ